MPFFLIFALFCPFPFLFSSFLTLNSAHSHAKFRYLSYCGIYFENLRFIAYYLEIKLSYLIFTKNKRFRVTENVYQYYAI